MVSFNNIKKMAVLILFIGVLITIIGLALGLKNIETKVYNLTVTLVVVIVGIFGYLGKYIQDVKSSEKTDKIITTTTNTQENILAQKKLIFLSNLRKYENLELKFRIEVSGMGKMQFMSYDKNSQIQLYKNFNLIIDQILQNNFVSENEEIYNEWKSVRNEIFVFLHIYSLPNGCPYNDETIISDEVRKQKLYELERQLMNSENKIYLLGQKDLEKMEIKK